MDVKQKVQKTYLFDPNEKIDLLVRWNSFSLEEIVQLGKVIDEYDENCKINIGEFQQKFISYIDKEKIQLQNAKKMKSVYAIDKIRNGIVPLFEA